MKVIFSGGGTGGHIFPAIAIADELKTMVQDTKILFIGAKGKIEEKIVPENNYELKTIPISGFNRKNLLSVLGLPGKIIKSVRLSKKIICDFAPDVVVGTGGFASAPVIYSAAKMKIPTLIQEGNSYPGKVTRFLSPRVNKVVVNFKDTLKYLKKTDNVVRISHPVRMKLKNIDRQEAIKFFNLNPSNKVLFIFGGSQGARAINQCMLNAYKNITAKNINIIWQTGKYEYDKIKEAIGDSANVCILDFIDKMDYAYSASDLIICRAGISSIMELSYLGLPAILIPYPLAAENHQEKNARSIENENACIVIVQNEIETKLYDTVINLIYDSAKLNNLKENIKKLSDDDAAKKIANEIIKLKNGR